MSSRSVVLASSPMLLKEVDHLKETAKAAADSSRDETPDDKGAGESRPRDILLLLLLLLLAIIATT